MTIAEMLVVALVDFGCKEIVPSGSKRYRKFTSPVRDDRFYWVGKNGALRFGRTVTYSTSREESRATFLKRYAFMQMDAEKPKP